MCKLQVVTIQAAASFDMEASSERKTKAEENKKKIVD